MSERIHAIYTAIEFIEDHLRKPITVADMAEAAGYSLYHFIRTFNQSVQHTPYDYLMRRRLSEAGLALLDSERRVIDIALDLQYNNHETFTRAFRRVFEMPPTLWRERGFADHRFLMPVLDRDYLDFLNTPDYVPPRMVEMDEIIVAGLMTPFTGDSEEITMLWQNLRGALQGLSINLGQPEYWGIRFQPQTPDGRLYYLAGVKIPTVESAPGAFVTKIIPSGDAICISQPSQSLNFDLALTVLYHTYLSKTDLALCEPLEVEHFGNRREIILPVQRSSEENNNLSKSNIGANNQDGPV